MPLNVMVLQSERGAAYQAALELTQAGHVVLRCHDPGASAFPCRGVEDQSSCPLRSHTVDVAVTVRSRPRSQPAPQEDGVRCALMHHVPLVVAGPTVLDPYEGYEARVLDRTADVVGACEEVAAAAQIRFDGSRDRRRAHLAHPSGWRAGFSGQPWRRPERATGDWFRRPQTTG
jgi:hypothetical protein